VVVLLPIIDRIDVSWRTEIVAGHEKRLQRSRSLVRNAVPGAPGEDERMPSPASVRRRDDIVAGRPPRSEDAFDGLG
jgi:hypothetical protein